MDIQIEISRYRNDVIKNKPKKKKRKTKSIQGRKPWQDIHQRINIGLIKGLVRGRYKEN